MSNSTSRNRWRLLVKTLGHDIQQLSSMDYDTRLAVKPGSGQEDPELILQKCQEMLHDLQDLLKEHKKHEKLKVTTAQNHVVTAKGKSTIEIHTGRPDIPLPPILATLKKIESDLSEINSLLSNLKSKNSAKAHRSLLEQQSILITKQKRLQKELDLMNVESRDLLTVGTARELHDTILSIINTATSPHDFLQFLKNVLIHAIILAIIEATFEEKRKARVSAVVGKILDLSVLAQQHGTDQASGMMQHLDAVFKHSAIVRLPLISLLDKPTLDRFNAREQDGAKKMPEGQDKKSVDDQIIKHWILTQTWVLSHELMIDSFALLPKTAGELAQDAAKSEVIGAGDKQQVKAADVASNNNFDQVAASPEIASHRGTDRAEKSGVGSQDPIDTTQLEIDTNDEEYALDFPSVPISAITPHDSQLDNDANEAEEVDAQRLMTLFAPSTSSETSSEDDEPDYSEMVDLTPAEQEEVLKALASAREHHIDANALEWKNDESVEELMRRAQSALQEFNQEVDEHTDHDPPDPENDDFKDDSSKMD